MRDELCKAFCGALTVRDVPAGLAVGTGFRRSNGDAVGFYVVFEPGNRSRARIEDDGQTLPSLIAAGVDVTSGPRAEMFSSLLNECCAEFDAEESVLHTPFMPASQLPAAAFAFVALLVRLQDFTLLTRERVEETFKDDVLSAVRERFAGRAEIRIDDPIRPDLAQFPADIVIIPPNDVRLGVFVGTSEPKALEAYILWMQLQMHTDESSRVMLVLDTARPTRIKERTLARVMTSFQMAVFPGQESETMDTMERLAFGAVARRTALPKLQNPLH